MSNFYSVKKEVPTLKSVLLQLKEDIGFKGEKEYLRKLLKAIGFKFKKCKNKRFLMERTDIVAQRARYLRRMKKNDELGENKKLVVYLDETWIHPTYTVSKCWQSNGVEGVLKNNSAGQRWIIVHAGSEKGFVKGAFLIFKSKTKSGDYHDEMNFQNFSKWVEEKLLPNLPSNCLIVLDNATYHSVQINKAPTLASRKSEIQDWLNTNGISFDEEMTKAELIHIVRMECPTPKYYIDSLFMNMAIKLSDYHLTIVPSMP